LIAEAWDAEGMYKVGGFPEGWAEWNGRFRDDVRRFVRGDEGMVADLVRRFGGSHDLFGAKHNPAHSINFVTCHDGFTLRDLVSYDRKHNARNGESNRDGTDANFSHNCGVEGATTDERISRLRVQQAKNMLAILMVSRGTPMILGGDELWRTQQGNNNTYCQDNELSWYCWDLNSYGEEMLRFVHKIIAFRKKHPALKRPLFVDPFTKDNHGVEGPGAARVSWHGVHLGDPDWSYQSHSIALQIQGRAPVGAPGTDDVDMYIALSAWREPLDFALPQVKDIHWYRVVDTSLPGPQDIVDESEAPVIDDPSYRVGPRSSLILVGRKQD